MTHYSFEDRSQLNGGNGVNPPQSYARAPYSAAPREGLRRDVLMGTDIHNTPVPAQTIRENPLIHFVNQETRQGFGITRDQLSKHLLLLGGIGSGKTNVFNFIIQQIAKGMTQDDVMIIFDTKGDFERHFYHPRDPNHIMIGNSPRYQQVTRHWNLFYEALQNNARLRDIEVTAKEIASQLFRGRGSETQPFFAQAATDLVAKMIIHHIREYVRTRDSSKLNNQNLVSRLRGAGIQEFTNILQAEGNRDFRNAQMYIGMPNQPLTGQALGVFGEIGSMVNDLFVGIFGDGTGDSKDFSMRQIVREKGQKIVFVEYDLSIGEVLGPIYRLLFDMALKEALSRSNEHEGSVYLIIDEFKLLPNLMHIDNALNFGRSLGVKVVAGIQSINQLYDIYGEYRGKALVAGFMNSFCFQTWDADSREYISKRFGDNYTSMVYDVYGTPERVQREGHVVEDWDILDLGIGQACVNLVGIPPFMFQFPEYR